MINVHRNCHVMRRISFVLLLVVIPMSSLGQVQDMTDTTGTVRIVYEQLDQIQKSTQVLLSETRGQVTFNLVRLENMGTDSILRGVEVTVSKGGEAQVSSMSTGMLGAAVGSKTDWVNPYGSVVQQTGFIFLSRSDLESVVQFLEKVPTQVTRDQRKMWKIWLNKDFEIGVDYSPENVRGGALRSGYSFLVTATGVTYEMNWEDGNDVKETLSLWSQRLSKTPE